ncbi:hypoxanthine phosphoribosyltransferase [Chloroflexota bacterium]
MNDSVSLHVIFPRPEIEAMVGRLAVELNRDYHGKQAILVGILKGSFIFMADLVRRLDFPLEVDFIRLSSYGGGTETSGKIKVVQPLGAMVRGRDVLVIEDIVDTGLTTGFLLGYLSRKKPASLRLCALLDKSSRRRLPVTIDYRGLAVPDKFLVGYGLDCNERFRNLPDICVLKGND